METAYRKALSGDRSAEHDLAAGRSRYGWRAWALWLQTSAFAEQYRGNWLSAHMAPWLWRTDSPLPGVDPDAVLDDPVFTDEIMPLFLESETRQLRRNEPNTLRQEIHEGSRPAMDDVTFDAHIERVIAGRMDELIARQPGDVAALLRALRIRLECDGGLTADFSYSPDFADGVARAREMAKTDPVAAWDHLRTALPLSCGNRATAIMSRRSVCSGTRR